MGRRLDSTRMANLATEKANLKALELDFRTYGDMELANAAKRAYRELDTPTVNGAVNTFGVNADAFRK